MAAAGTPRSVSNELVDPGGRNTMAAQLDNKRSRRKNPATSPRVQDASWQNARDRGEDLTRDNDRGGRQKARRRAPANASPRLGLDNSQRFSESSSRERSTISAEDEGKDRSARTRRTPRSNARPPRSGGAASPPKSRTPREDSDYGSPKPVEAPPPLEDKPATPPGMQPASLSLRQKVKKKKKPREVPAILPLPGQLSLALPPPEIPTLPKMLGSEAPSEIGDFGDLKAELEALGDGKDEDILSTSSSSHKRKSWQAELPFSVPQEDEVDLVAATDQSPSVFPGSDSPGGQGWAAGQLLRSAAMANTDTSTKETPPAADGGNLSGSTAPGMSPRSQKTNDRKSGHTIQSLGLSRSTGSLPSLTQVNVKKAVKDLTRSASRGTTSVLSHSRPSSPASSPNVFSPRSKLSMASRFDVRRGRSRNFDTDGTKCCKWKFLQGLVTHRFFEPFFALLILGNTFVMATEMQYHGKDHGYRMQYPGEVHEAHESWPWAEETFKWCELIFGSFFALELLLKLGGLGTTFFKDIWNWLDFVIVTFWCIGTVGENLLPLDPTILRMVRLVRLLRLLRLVKTMQGFESLYLMTTSIKASILALTWSAVLLFLLQMSFALVLNQVLLGFIQDTDNDIEKRKNVFRYFGTFSKAFLTMFEFMLANWPPSSRVLTEDVNEFYLLFVLGYQCIIGFAVVKVIMGVFLQVTFNVAATDDVIMLNQRERAVRTHTKKMSRLFMAADADGNGFMDREEFRNMVDDPVVRQWLSSMDCDVSLFAKDPDVLFSLVDDGDDELTAEELVKGVARMQGPARSVDLAILADDNSQIKDIVKEMKGEVGKLRAALGKRIESTLALARGEQPPRPSQMSSLAPPRLSKRHSSQTSNKEKRPRLSRVATKVGAMLFRGKNGDKDDDQDEDSRTRFLSTHLAWVLGPRFEALFGLLIFANTALMAVEVQYMGMDAGYQLEYRNYERPARETWPWAEKMFSFFDWFFLVVFTLEVVLKLMAMSCPFFLDPWNWFDFLLVFFTLTEKTLSGMVDPAMLRLARMARLLRMLRLVRTIQGFDSLYLMTTSIKGSLSALLWFSLLMFVVQMLIALMLNMLLENWLLDDENPQSKRHLIFKYFGTFSKAILTMFEITLANWIPVCRALTENVSEWYVLFALVHKFIIGFAVVMVMTGVFLQETFKVAATDDTIMINNKQRQTKIHAKKMKNLFEAADDENLGLLTKEKFQAMIEDVNVRTYLASMGLEVANSEDLWKMVSKDAQTAGQITLQELSKGMARLKGHAKSIDLAVVLHANTKLLDEARELQAQVAELKEMRRRALESSCQAELAPGSLTVT